MAYILTINIICTLFIHLLAVEAILTKILVFVTSPVDLINLQRAPLQSTDLQSHDSVFFFEGKLKKKSQTEKIVKLNNKLYTSGCCFEENRSEKKVKLKKLFFNISLTT